MAEDWQQSDLKGLSVYWSMAYTNFHSRYPQLSVEHIWTPASARQPDLKQLSVMQPDLDQHSLKQADMEQTLMPGVFKSETVGCGLFLSISVGQVLQSYMQFQQNFSASNLEANLETTLGKYVHFSTL